MRKTLFILPSLLLVLANFAIAQQKNVSATLDSTKILIGQQLVIHLTASFPAQDTLFWPTFTDSIGNLEIVDKSRIDSSFDSNSITTRIIRQNILITSFDTGFFPIPPIQFQFKDTVIETEPLLIQVTTVAIDTSKGIYDIREPYQVPFNILSWLKKYKYWLGGGLAIVIIAIALLAWIVFKKPKELVAAKPKKPKIPAHKIALKKLKDVEHQKLWQHDKVKLYHSSISEIIREYLELRFNIIALESTTPEIMRATRSLPISDEQREKLHQLLTLSDLVKFAKASPVPNENEQSIQNAISFVKSTILKERKLNG
ncbi:MAG: hypothetical protein JKY42_08675 [Flavobacteriales bacterium]|nr:hypothetical protein [Flavobacteriales bacterium]